jgi:hypothetical protein
MSFKGRIRARSGESGCGCKITSPSSIAHQQHANPPRVSKKLMGLSDSRLHGPDRLNVHRYFEIPHCNGTRVAVATTARILSNRATRTAGLIVFGRLTCDRAEPGSWLYAQYSREISLRPRPCYAPVAACSLPAGTEQFPNGCCP